MRFTWLAQALHLVDTCSAGWHAGRHRGRSKPSITGPHLVDHSVRAFAQEALHLRGARLSERALQPRAHCCTTTSLLLKRAGRACASLGAAPAGAGAARLRAHLELAAWRWARWARAVGGVHRGGRDQAHCLHCALCVRCGEGNGQVRGVSRQQCDEATLAVLQHRLHHRTGDAIAAAVAWGGGGGLLLRARGRASLGSKAVRSPPAASVSRCSNASASFTFNHAARPCTWRQVTAAWGARARPSSRPAERRPYVSV